MLLRVSMASIRCCFALALILANTCGRAAANWHGNKPHNVRASPSCFMAPRHGNSDCSAGKHCGITDNYVYLSERGAKLPAVMPDYYGANCTHLACGCKVDGVGSQMQGKLSTYAYAQAIGKVYVHFPMARSKGHFDSEDEEMKMVKALEEFFNLGHGEMSLEQAAKSDVMVCAVEHCHTFIDEGGESCYDRVKAEIRRKYDSSPKPAPLHNPSMITIAVHVRRGDVKDDAGRVQPHYDMRYSPDQYYIDTLTAIKQSLPANMVQRLDILLLSEGAASDFSAVTNAHPDARLVLSGDLLQSLHSMITADILVIAHSSFSFVAGLYNTGIVVYSHFWHAPPKSWLQNPWPPLLRNETADGQEDTPCRQLMQLLNTTAAHTLLENRWRSRNAQL